MVLQKAHDDIEAIPIEMDDGCRNEEAHSDVHVNDLKDRIEHVGEGKTFEDFELWGKEES